MNLYDLHRALKFEHPTLVCLRGVPGSGKTVKGQELLAKWGERAVVHSTDAYFMVNGVYRFDPTMLPVYHKRNLEAAFDSMVAGIPIVIIDNTNLKAAHFYPYYELAQMAGYRLLVIEAPGMQLEPKALAARNTKGVSADVIEMMMRKFESEKEFIKKLEALWEQRQQPRAEQTTETTG